MANRSIPCTATMVLTLLATVPCTLAQSREGVRATAPVSGICTDRLTASQLRIWESIQGIVFARDKEGRPAHPMLYSLWQRVQESGCTIEVEFIDRGRTKVNLAGQFLIEEVDSGRGSLSGVIQLNLTVIDRASVNKRSRSTAGYTRFEGLTRIERYAEVLGHELSHVVLALEDEGYERTLRELDTAVKIFRSSRRQIGRDFGLSDAERPFLSRIDSLGIQMENPANDVEARVWRELRSSSEPSWRKQ
jgi:hypothetical protein